MVGLVLSVVLAQAAPDGYEERLIHWALAQQDRELEPSPAGKRVEEVLIASENVFAPSDPWPTILNVFHAKTREGVIAREVLLQPGDVWDDARVKETERNLRHLFILAVAKVVPVKGRAGGIGVLVVAKDRWSLRLNSQFTVIGPLLQYLRLQPTEMNFLGSGQQLAGDFILRLDTLQVGETFVEPRLFGTRLLLNESAALVFNRRTGAVEGTAGVVQLARPLITLDQAWGFDVQGTWNARRRRVYRGASVWQLPYPDENGTEVVPDISDVRELDVEASGVRSFGREFKTDVTGAIGAYSHQYTVPAASQLTPEQRDWFVANYLPRSEDAAYASAFVRAYRADFRVLQNIDSLELSEDYQVGPLFQAGVRWAPIATDRYLEGGAAFRYRLLEHDDLLTVSIAAAARLRGAGQAVNERVAAEVSNYSPPFEGGRFVARVLLDVKVNDLDHRQLLLGGSTGLRGAYPEEFSGRNLVLGNFEYRARAFELATVWVSLVLFYDVGSAFDSKPQLTHTVGFGARVLLPQFNQEVIRFDFGVVLGGDVPGLDRLNVSYGQVTDLRPSFLDQPL